MLRVRPLVHTSDLPRAAGFLRALGLAPTTAPAPDNSAAAIGAVFGAASVAVFDAGSGRVALHASAPGSPEENTTTLGFDVGDVREFARRTREAGTAVELSQGDHGPAAHITAPGGVLLRADAGPRETAAPPSPLTVAARWYSPDVEAAGQVLEDIGAKPRNSSDGGTGRDFRAKNGGVVVARTAARTTVELGFEYDGDVRDLMPGLEGGGFGPVIVDGCAGRSLHVTAPWDAEVRVDERRDAG